ncbi:MAG TPA: hypothetical protein VF647_05185 [Longimicrobium sp.]
MPPASPSPVTIALITAGAAFSAAVLAQLLAHVFTVRRERRADARAVYQKLYAPIIFEVFLYLDANRAYDAQDVVSGSAERLLERIDVHVADHLSVASPRLIEAYYQTRRHRFLDDDMRGYGQEIALRRFLTVLVEEFLSTARRIGFLGSDQRRQVERTAMIFTIWETASRVYGDDRSNLVLRHLWLLEERKTGWWFRRRLTRLARAGLRELANSQHAFESLLIDATDQQRGSRHTMREALNGLGPYRL